MSVRRRLSAVLVTASLGWTGLAIGVTAPAAQGAGGQAPAGASAVAQRGTPHDPATYYAGTEGLTGQPLATRLHTIVAGHTRLSYDQLWNALPLTDADPNNPATSITDFYAGTSLLKSAMCNHSGSCAGEWNREHSWAKSHGDFGTVTGPGTDLFHMRPELADVNSSRSNLDFDNGGSATIANCPACKKDSDSFEPRAAIKGDVARGLFYMAVRYDGGDGFPDLVMNDFTCNAGSKAPNHGKLSTLVAWSLADPPDAVEQARNDLVDGDYQHNRNPFIDHPEWVTSIWGDGVGQGPACGTTGGGTGPTDPGPGTGTPPSNVVISEAYVNGGSSGATYTNKFVELYNPLTSAVDLSPYSLQYRSPTGTGNATGRYDFATGAQVAPRSYFVVKLASNGAAGADLPRVDADAGNSVNPGAAGGTLFLAGTHANVAPSDDSVGDTIGYGTSNAPETAAASGNTVTKSLQRNATNSDTDDNRTDFAAGTPTPGAGLDGNRAPTTSPMSATTTEDTAVDVPLLANDPDGDPLTWSTGPGPSHGSVSITGATLTYTPAADFHGDDQVAVTVSDGRGGVAGTTVSLAVSSVNDAPVAYDVTASTPRGSSTQITLAGSDVDDTDLTYAIVSPPAHGSVTVVGATATYAPTAGYVGDDAFTYTVRDPGGLSSAPASVSITVTSDQQAPTATDASATTAEDESVTLTLPASDPNDDPLTYAVATPPAHGSVTIAGNQATYTPAADYHGPDAFTFTAADASATSAPANVAINVIPVNDPPVAVPKSATTAEDTATTITLSGTDVDGDVLAFALAAQPEHGAVTLSGAQATYTPATDFHGQDAFTWTVSDGVATTTGTATVEVTPVNDRPTAAVVSAATDEDGGVTIPLAGSDVDGDALSYALGTGPSHGTVGVAGGTATYTPTPGWSGVDTFTYTASDAALTSAPATVTVQVAPINHAPTISATLLRTTAGSPVTATLEASDQDLGDTVRITAVTTPEHGTVTFSGMSVTYTPRTRSGTETFIVTVTDSRGATATAQVGVEITARSASLVVAASDLRRGSSGTVTVAVAGAGGPVPTGTVTLTSDGVEIGSSELDPSGTATIGISPREAGAARWVASYDGDGVYAPAASDPMSVTIARSVARLRFSSVGTLERGRRGVVTVAVRTVADVAATGRLTLKVGPKKLSTKVRRGVATFRIATLPKRPKLKVTARYVGDTQYAARSGTHAFTLAR